MNLVSYASSDSSSSPSRDASPASQTRPLKRPRPTDDSTAAVSLPPPPPSFANLYTTTPRASTSDDPSLHGGRQRSVPHATGTWPSHVYIEWTPSGAESAQLASLITSVTSPHGNSETHSLLRSPLGAPAPLHISLSRTLPVQTEQREDFLARLRTALDRNQTSSLASTSKPKAEATLATPRWVLNGERTRWFLVLAAFDSDGVLERTLRACNDVVHEMGWPKLYVREHDQHEHERDDEAILGGRLHVSVAWALAEGKEVSQGAHVTQSNHGTDKDKTAVSCTEDDARYGHLYADIRVPLVAVKVKMGNGVTEVPLFAAGGGGRGG